MGSVLIAIIEFVPAGISVLALAGVLWLIVQGKLTTDKHIQSAYKHLDSEIAAREREENRHSETLGELRRNTHQIERMADSLANINTTITGLNELRRVVDRIDNNIRG